MADAMVAFPPNLQLLFDHVEVGDMQGPYVLLRQLDRDSLCGCYVSAMAVQQNDPLKTVSFDAPADVAKHVDVRFQCHGDRADVSHIEVGKTCPDGRRNDDGVLLHTGCYFCRHMIGDTYIDIHRTVRSMLLDRPNGNDHDRGMFECLFQFVTPELLPKNLCVRSVIRFAIHVTYLSRWDVN